MRLSLCAVHKIDFQLIIYNHFWELLQSTIWTQFQTGIVAVEMAIGDECYEKIFLPKMFVAAEELLGCWLAFEKV